MSNNSIKLPIKSLDFDKFVKNYPKYKIINLDNLTYASSLNNLKDVENKPNYKFIKQDICDYRKIKEIFGTNFKTHANEQLIILENI